MSVDMKDSEASLCSDQFVLDTHDQLSAFVFSSDPEQQKRKEKMLCSLQIGVGVEECLMALCAENLSFDEIDKFDLKNRVAFYLNNEKFGVYARLIYMKIEDMEQHREAYEVLRRQTQQTENSCVEFSDKTRWMQIAMETDDDEDPKPIKSQNNNDLRKKCKPKKIKKEKKRKQDRDGNKNKNQEKLPLVLKISTFAMAEFKKIKLEEESFTETNEAQIVFPAKIETEATLFNVTQAQNLAPVQNETNVESAHSDIAQVLHPAQKDKETKLAVSSNRRNWSKTTRNYEKCYKKQVKIEFKNHVAEKTKNDTWTSFYKKLFQERAETQNSTRTTEAANSNDMPEDIESPSFRIPPARISPTFWENRKKYGL